MHLKGSSFGSFGTLTLKAFGENGRELKADPEVVPGGDWWCVSVCVCVCVCA